MSPEELGILRKASYDFISKNYIQFWDAEDLINEGYLVLNKIRDKYKEDLQTKYTTYLYNQFTYHFLNITRKDRSGIIINSEDEFEVSMPEGAEVLSFNNQKGKACIWVKVNTDKPLSFKRFRQAGTNHPLTNNLKYIGTSQFMNGSFVLHLFEVL